MADLKPQVQANLDNRTSQSPMSAADMTGYFIDLLIQKHSSPRNVFDPGLREGYPIWKAAVEDPPGEQRNDTEINILRGGEFDPRSADLRPALIVRRGPVRPTDTRVMSDKQGQIGGLIGTVEDPNQQPTMGHEQYSSLIEGSHIIKIYGQSADFTDRLAYEIWRYLLAFQQIIRKDLGLDQFRLGELPELRPEKDKEVTTHYSCELAVGWRKWESTLMVERSPILKTIVSAIPAQSGGVQGCPGGR